VVIKHPDNQHTIYWHLSAVHVSLGDQVNDGEQIGLSGNSGYSCGAHLHYALFASADLSAGNSLVPDGRWTVEAGHPGTNHPGRVPWLASYWNEHSYNGYTMLRYTTRQTWVEFRNDGGRPWINNNYYNGTGRVMLYATNSSGTATRNSSFAASDWPYVYSPGKADVATVNPGQVGRFTFNLYAAFEGNYTERFSLGAHKIKNGSLYFFNYAALGNYYIPITVTHCC
jgi:murein DD-endopeptidase MepM/ murein hydrolase activator NlpD